ncbi:hypothetical protein N8Y79_20685, partial [Enterobacter hormaechei subsp. steigerwaltii]|nr:hypothetical protein [Enterobacter hormaechei subsp. steigerwaltii]
FGFAENTDDLFVGKTLLHGDVLMWLMKTLLTSGCTNQRGAGQKCKTCRSKISGGGYCLFFHLNPRAVNQRPDLTGKADNKAGKQC